VINAVSKDMYECLKEKEKEKKRKRTSKSQNKPLNDNTKAMRCSPSGSRKKLEIITSKGRRRDKNKSNDLV